MGCSSSKENQPKKDAKGQEAKKENKPQEAKKENKPQPQEAKKENKPQGTKPADKPQAAQPAAAASPETAVKADAGENKQQAAPPSVSESVPNSAHVSVPEPVQEPAKAPSEQAKTPSERAQSPPPAAATAATRANVPELQMGTSPTQSANRASQTPRGERLLSPRRYPVEVAIRRESVGGSPASRKVAVTDYTGAGPTTDFPVESVYRCFDEGNGLLFRLVNETRHIWAFYNDTQVYTMHVAVTFGHESMVRALGKTTQEVHDAETGHCTLEVDVAPGETQLFMRGEYNGFVTYYDADPIPYDARKK